MARTEIPIANLKTKVPIKRTVAAIQKLVEQFLATEFRVVYDDGEPCAVRFAIQDPYILSPPSGEPNVYTVRLVARHAMIFDRMCQKANVAKYEHERRQKIAEQARRVAWRQLHDTVRVQLMAIGAGIYTPAEAFLAHLVVIPPHGTETTFGEALVAGGILSHRDGRLLLGPGT